MKNFKFNIVIRLIVITAIISTMVYFLFANTHYLRSFYLLLFLTIAFAELLWYVDRTNRDFKAFLLALLQNDFTTRFSEHAKGKSFNEFYQVLNQITDRFERISSEKQAQHIYLESLVEHVRVGIISFDENEKIQLVNQATKSLLGISQIITLKSIGRVDENLLQTIKKIRPGENQIIKLVANNALLQLNVHASEFRLQGKYFKLVSLQNIKNALDQNEMLAWQKLIRVLTHEIMNSVTPITSLTGTLKQIVDKKRSEKSPIDEPTVEKLWVGLDAVENRSEGLKSFTQSYRKLTKVPTPVFTEIDLKQQLDRILELLKNETKEVDISLSIAKNTVLLADPDLIDQVLINLIKNALDALIGVKEPRLSISYQNDGVINITDNGLGIEQEKLDQIFIPFFTTKKEGSGIGLALSQQIMHLHNGKIEVTSTPGRGTTFTLKF